MSSVDSDEAPLTSDRSPSAATTNPPLKPSMKLFAKLLLGLVLIVLSRCIMFYGTLGLFLVPIFVGIYLVLDFISTFLPSNPVAIKVEDKVLVIPLGNKENLRLGLIGFLGTLLLFLECLIRWNIFTIIGFTFSVAVVISVGVAVTFKVYNVKSDNGSFVMATAAGQPDSLMFASLIREVLSILSASWLGLNSDMKSGKSFFRQARPGYLLLALATLGLAVTVVVQELSMSWLDWTCSNRLYSRRWLWGWLGEMGCSCGYWAGISAACTLVVLIPVVAAVFRPSRPAALIAGVLSTAYGIYMSLLSDYTVQSMLYLGNMSNVSLQYQGRAARYARLMPVQYIAALLILIGFSMLANCFQLKRVDKRSKLIRFLYFLALCCVCALSVINMIVTQLHANDQLKQQWVTYESRYGYDSDSVYIPWNYANSYTLYTVSCLCTSLFLMLCAMFRLLNWRTEVPGVLVWLAGVAQFCFSVFSAYTFTHAAPFPGPDSVPELLVLRDVPNWIFAINMSVILVSCLAGISNMLFNSVYLLQLIVAFLSLMLLPFLGLFGWLFSKVQSTEQTVETEEQYEQSQTEPPQSHSKRILVQEED